MAVGAATSGSSFQVLEHMDLPVLTVVGEMNTTETKGSSF